MPYDYFSFYVVCLCEDLPSASFEEGDTHGWSMGHRKTVVRLISESNCSPPLGICVPPWCVGQMDILVLAPSSPQTGHIQKCIHKYKPMLTQNILSLSGGVLCCV